MECVGESGLKHGGSNEGEQLRWLQLANLEAQSREAYVPEQPHFAQHRRRSKRRYASMNVPALLRRIISATSLARAASI